MGRQETVGEKEETLCGATFASNSFPYPVGSLKLAPYKIDYSYVDEATIEIALLPKAGAKIKPQLFSLLLNQVRGADGKRHWIVDNWVPISHPFVRQPN